MDSYATSEPINAPVFTVCSRRDGEEAPKKMKEIKDDIRQEDELLEKLEEMFQKLENGYLKKDAWAGEDVDCPSDTQLKDVNEMRKISKKKKLSKAELLAANKTNQERTLYVAKQEENEMAPSKRNRFSFKDKQAVPQKKTKEGKIKTEDELRQIMNLALQRHEKKKRRRTRGPRNGKKLVATEDRPENMQSFDDGSCKEKQTSAEEITPVHTHLVSSCNTEKKKEKWDQIKSVHDELRAMHLSKTNIDLDEVKRYVNEIVNKAQQKVLKEATAFKVLQAEESAKTKNVKNAIRAVHRELLNVFNSGARKIIPDYHEKAKAKREQMLVVHDELKKTVIQMKAARTEGFAQMRAEQKKMSAIHAEINASHLSKKKTDFDEVKKYVNDIINKAQQKVLKEATALKVLQAEESSKINSVRDAIRAINKELLSVFNSGARKTILDYHEKAKAKREQMFSVHDELKRLVFLRGLCLEEDDDDNFVPRKMFLFEIANFQKVSQIEMPLHVHLVQDKPSSSDEESEADRVEENRAPPKNERRSLGQRLLRFFGFR